MKTSLIIKNERPKELGYHMKAEWEPHEATWLSWPHNEETWPGNLLGSVEALYVQMIALLSLGEKVEILFSSSEEEDKAYQALQSYEHNIQNIHFHPIQTVDVWIRDYGPNFIVGAKGKVAFNNWIFNAWGEKYDSLMLDNRIPEEIHSSLKLTRFDPGIILEGGSIDVNGRGLCLTTEQCLLNPNRNPHLSKTDIEQYLTDYLGVSEIIWLKSGIEGDDTDGHIDDIARFINPTTIMIAHEENTEAPNYQALQENIKILENYGSRFNLIKIPMPDPVVVDGDVLPASYANFYIGNAVVLVPIYDKNKDAKVLKLFREFFPKRKVKGLECKDLVYGFGSIHCVTQQEPKH